MAEISSGVRNSPVGNSAILYPETVSLILSSGSTIPWGSSAGMKQNICPSGMASTRYIGFSQEPSLRLARRNAVGIDSFQSCSKIMQLSSRDMLSGTSRARQLSKFGNQFRMVSRIDSVTECFGSYTTSQFPLPLKHIAVKPPSSFLQWGQTARLNERFSMVLTASGLFSQSTRAWMVIGNNFPHFEQRMVFSVFSLILSSLHIASTALNGNCGFLLPAICS